MNPTPRNLSKLHFLESHLHQLMSAAKLLLDRNLSMQGSANIFRYLSKLTSTGIIPPVVSLDSSSGSTDFEKVTLFNSSFHSIFTQKFHHQKSYQLLPQHYQILVYLKWMCFKLCHPSKSSGLDGISPKILKYCALALYTIYIC